MSSLFVENFEAGLDTRKSAFTAPPGSLRGLVNAHITRGKEIEQRKAFTAVYNLPSSTVGLHSVQGNLYTFGSGGEPSSMPEAVSYQRLQAPSGDPLVDILDVENFAGKIYAIAEFDNGYIHHFYNGALVADWDTIGGQVGSPETLASALGARLDTEGSVDVNVVGNIITLTGVVPGESFGVSTNNDTYTVISERQAAKPATPETPATATFRITGGSQAQTYNTVARVVVNGVDVMGAAIDHTGRNDTTAAAVAAAINAYVTGYSATASAETVTLTATPGLGASANGYTLQVVTTGDVQANYDGSFSGGKNPTSAVPQITRLTISGVWDVDRYHRVTLNSDSYKMRGRSSGMGTSIRAVKDKLYAVTQSLIYFNGYTGTPPSSNPAQWSSDVTGTGFINLSTQYDGSEDLNGVGVYQGRVAAFSRRSVQIWDVDADPNLNTPYQTLLNVGAIAPDSIVEYGDLDIFFLSESGVRSLRARDSSNLASANDVGVAIDGELIDYMAGLSRRQVRGATAVVEPTDSRYLLAIGSRVYVFSNFPGSSVAAWSTYDLGGQVSHWAVAGSRLYARVGDSVRLYGGFTGEDYDDSAEIILPFLDASNPAEMKQLQGLDVGAIGDWDVDIALEPDLPDEWERVASLTQGSYGSMARLGVAGQSTHVALRLTSRGGGRALVGNLMIHYQALRTD